MSIELSQQHEEIPHAQNNAPNVASVVEPRSGNDEKPEVPVANQEEMTFTNKQNQLDLIWKNITVKTKGKNQKILLDNVDGRVKSGQCLAILGSSGAGKTTMMNFLSKKIESKNFEMSGSVTLNGEEVDTEKFAKITAYVMQDDILEPCMTPNEILLFTAKLKLNLPNEKIEEKVAKMIEDLHLERCCNTQVGTIGIRGVSGGERKRTSIGVELIWDPLIIFLDEPTSGLDSFNAYETISLLSSMAKERKKIIVFTIHQPASEIFQLLDQICVIALGKTVYYGQKDKSYDCFEMLQLPIPENYNPFEHFIEVTNLANIDDKFVIKHYAEKYTESKTSEEKYEAYISDIHSQYKKNLHLYQDNTPCINGFSEDFKKILNKEGRARHFCYQLGMLFGRTMIIQRRKFKAVILKIVQSLFTSILLAALFVRMTKNATGVQDRVGILFNSMFGIIMGNNFASLLTLSDEKKVFTRERANNLYSILAYFVSKNLAEIPSTIIMVSLFSVNTYWSTELSDTYSYKYYTFIGILLLGAFVGSSYSLCLGAIVANPEQLVNMNTALIIPMMLLSGFFANADNFAPYLIPFKYISAFKYSFQALIHLEFSDMQPLNCFNLAPQICSPIPTRFQFLEPFYISLIALGALNVFFRILGFILIYFFTKIKV